MKRDRRLEPNRKKRELAKNISHHTDIRLDVVEIILNGAIDVIMEEIVNEGEFEIKQLFTVSNAEWGSYTINGTQKVPKHFRLKIALNRAVKTLWKTRHSRFNGEKGHITKDNWRDILRSTQPENSKKVVENLEDNYNPFLDDDEDF